MIILRNNKDTENEFASISKQHKILLNIYKKVEKYLPKYEDEYRRPGLNLFTYHTSYDPDEDDFGKINLGFQREEFYEWDGKNWIELTKGKKIYNLKTDILKNLEKYKKEWEKIDYLDEEWRDEVVNYLGVLIDEIQKSNL